jgi:hypothetical protein
MNFFIIGLPFIRLPNLADFEQLPVRIPKEASDLPTPVERSGGEIGATAPNQIEGEQHTAS